MFHSLLIKLVMLGATVCLVLWIGWPLPHDIEWGAERGDKAATEGDSGATQQVRVGTGVQPGATLDRETPREHSRLVDLNRAGVEDLKTLPGIGAVLAERIVAMRTEEGGFTSVEDLRAVKGIGEKRLERLRSHVMVSNSKGRATIEERTHGHRRGDRRSS